MARPSRKMIQARAQPAGRLRAPKGGRGRQLALHRLPVPGSRSGPRAVFAYPPCPGRYPQRRPSSRRCIWRLSTSSRRCSGCLAAKFQPSPHLHSHHRHSPPPPLPTPTFARSCPRIARLDPSADGARIPARLAGAAPPMAPPPAPRPPSAAPPSARSVGRRGRRMHARPSPRAGVAASPPARLLPRGKGVFARAFRVPQASVGPVRWRWRASARMSCIVTGTCET